MVIVLNALLNNVERDYLSIMQIAIAEIQIYRYCCLFASCMWNDLIFVGKEEKAIKIRLMERGENFIWHQATNTCYTIWLWKKKWKLMLNALCFYL